MYNLGIEFTVFDQLITKAYEIGTGESTPQDFLKMYGNIFKSQSLVIMGVDAQRPGRDVFAHVGFNTTGISVYTEYYSAINPYAKLLWAAPPLSVCQSTDYVTEEEFSKTEYYNDFIVPNEDVRQAHGVSIFKENDRFLFWASHYNSRHIEEAKRSEAAVELLVSHLRRGFELARRLRIQNFEKRILEEILNELSRPFFLCDASLHIEFNNRAAEDELSKASLISAQGGKLRFRIPSVQIEIAQRAGKYARGEFIPSDDNNPLVLSLAPHSSQFVFLTPLPDPAAERSTVFGRFLHRKVLIMLGSPEKTQNAGDEIIQLVFGLTPAEASLANALSKGMTPNEFAEIRGISRNTARVHTQAILNKMGARRQSDVVRMVTNACSGIAF